MRPIQISGLFLRQPSFCCAESGTAKKACIFAPQSWQSKLSALWMAVLFVCSAVLFSGQSNAQEIESSRFPYQAIIKTDKANIHSGPGKSHYITRHLDQGSTVEVYRHDPGGWCAIRPPEGSFGLVPATSVEEKGNAVGEITQDGTQAWVGTEDGPVEKPLWQVKLKAGEKVTLLGVATWPDPAGFTTSWYQIKPPAGEFRWIKLDDLKLPPDLMTNGSRSDEGAETPTPPRDVQPELIGSTVKSLNEIEPVNAGFQSQVDSNANEKSGWEDPSYNVAASFQVQERSRFDQPRTSGNDPGWRKARTPIDRDSTNRFSQDNQGWGSNNVSAQTQNSIDRPERFAANNLDSRFDFGQLPVSSSGSGNRELSAGIQTNVPLTPRMTELELKLNQEMIKEPNQWRINDLEGTAKKIFESTSDPLEQSQAQRFLAKITNCRSIRDRFLGSSGRGSEPVSTSGGNAVGGNAPPSSPQINPNEKAFSLNSIYDAHGWLNELAQDGGKVDPTYVLQDENGKITHHVQPGPGMNLSSYKNKRIGVIGQRGYHTRLKLDHVTVQKVIELNVER